MSPKTNNLSANDAWKALIEKYNIIDEVNKNGIFHIKASQIKELKEPRLMAKWDSTNSLPEALRDNRINILPDSRSSYVISDFLLYQEIPELEEKVTEMSSVNLPEYESIDIDNIYSESNAINVLLLSGILDDFLGTTENIETFNGRMGTGEFEFYVDSVKGVKRHVAVNNAQCEIDGGFENNESVVIMEAKNVVHEDFHIRQLYYPYRLWKTKVNKPIRLVFSIYSNKIYRLFEYKFTNINDYSSIELVNTKNYSLQDTTISLDDLISVRQNVHIRESEPEVPFLQANSMNRVISLLENMYDNPMTEIQVADLMTFTTRQSQYYYNAGKYLGLFTKIRIDGQTYSCLTPLGEKVYKLEYKERQLKLVGLILEHKLFAELFDLVLKEGEQPSKECVKHIMSDFKVCGESLIDRRSSTVMRWMAWIFNLINL